MTQRMKRCPNINAILDLVAFYFVYTVCTGYVYTNIVKPMVEIPKIDLLNQLPSSRFNITQGYHPSVVNRYLTEGIKLDDRIRINHDSVGTGTGSIQNVVHENLIRVLQQTIDDDNKSFEEKNGIVFVSQSGPSNRLSSSSSSSCTIDDLDNSTMEDPNQCEASTKNYDVMRNMSTPFHKNWFGDKNHNMDGENNYDDELWKHYQMDVSSHFVVFQELETKWTEEDYAFCG